MHLCLFEDDAAHHLAPLTLTRALSDLRPGLRTLGETATEALADVTSGTVVFAVREAVAAVTAEAHPDMRILALGPDLAPPAPTEATVFVNAAYAAHPGAMLDRLRTAIGEGAPVAFWQDDTLVAAVVSAGQALAHLPRETVAGARLVTRLWHLAPHVRAFIEADAAFRFGSTPAVHDGATVHPSAILVTPERIHLAPGSHIRAGAIVSAENGPVVLAENAEIFEGAVVRGPVVIGAGAQVKPLASIEGTSIGPGCRVGGEVHTSIFQEFSNKGHSGFLGHSVVGAWCNLGASSDTSNLRNDYSANTLFDRAEGTFVDTGEQFLGLVLGDHAKCSIGTTFNTATVVGVGCNLYDAGFHDRHVPDFSWGSPGAYVPYRFDKFERVLTAVLARRGRTPTDAERTLLRRIAEATGAKVP